MEFSNLTNYKTGSKIVPLQQNIDEARILIDDLLKAVVHFHKPSQNIKLMEQTAMLGIHNS